MSILVKPRALCLSIDFGREQERDDAGGWKRFVRDTCAFSTEPVGMRWVEQSMVRETPQRASRSGDDAALRAIEQGDRAALAKALQSGPVRIKAALNLLHAVPSNIIRRFTN